LPTSAPPVLTKDLKAMGLVVSVASGKGGTGKTTLVASFAALAGSVVVADCDVDASNLHMLLNPEVMEEEK